MTDEFILEDDFQETNKNNLLEKTYAKLKNLEKKIDKNTQEIIKQYNNGNNLQTITDEYLIERYYNVNSENDYLLEVYDNNSGKCFYYTLGKGIVQGTVALRHILSDYFSELFDVKTITQICEDLAKNKTWQLSVEHLSFQVVTTEN
ncbi:hypothetical protein [Pseudolactococcus insecticola]|uniref:Uncharacterized protein n=1 Tax=Pseudolactococcus insecticola TaxID=2709158 RepID=A0A6A0B7N1_9LACT|nr:hypothetical protein [Lactococcus insecticola]GFH41429.1 hypothetical protein Hs20B_18270 [Lactococcus insecticola]